MTDAKLIFFTTSYVPENKAGRFSDDVPKYNRATMEIMKRHGVAVNDIYDSPVSIHHRLGKGLDDVHYTKEGYKELGKSIIDYLSRKME